MASERIIVLTHWQIHHLQISPRLADLWYPGAKNMVVTGTVHNDFSGKHQPGDHYRSAMITDFNSRDKIIDTVTSIILLSEEEGDPYVDGDMGNDVLLLEY